MSQNIQKICSEVRSFKQMFSDTTGCIELNTNNYDLPYIEAPLKTGDYSAQAGCSSYTLFAR